MRITQQLLTNWTRQGGDKAAKALLDASRGLQAGTAIEKASDDPVKASRLQGLRDAQAEITRQERSRQLVATDLGLAEEVLNSVHELVLDARDVGMAMANDTADADTRALSADRIRGILDQVIGLANRRDPSGKHLFSGLAEDTAPFSSTGVYQGDDGQRFVEVGAGVRVEGTVRGRDAFGSNFEVMGGLRALADALGTGDASKIRDAVELLDDARGIVSRGRSDIGSRLATLRDVDEVASSMRFHLETEGGALTGVDIAQAAPAMQSAQTTLEAVISVSRQIMAQVGRGWLDR